MVEFPPRSGANSLGSSSNSGRTFGIQRRPLTWVAEQRHGADEILKPAKRLCRERPCWFDLAVGRDQGDEAELPRDCCFAFVASDSSSSRAAVKSAGFRSVSVRTRSKMTLPSGRAC